LRAPESQKRERARWRAQNVPVVLTTKGNVPLPGTFRLAQKPMDESVSPGVSVLFQEQHGVAVISPLAPLKLPFHELVMVAAFVFNVTVKLEAVWVELLVTSSVVQ
jgi:hypothetical protein